MEEKVVAESLFKGKKENYPGSIKEMFVDSRLGGYITICKLRSVIYYKAGHFLMKFSWFESFGWLFFNL